jgi:hypothetical protein
MLKPFIGAIAALVKLLGSKPSFLTVISTVLSVLPSLIKNVIDFKATNAKEKVDEFLAALDSYTGTDEGAVTIFPHMPKEREEEFWDAIGLAVKNFAYEELKIEGYYR